MITPKEAFVALEDCLQAEAESAEKRIDNCLRNAYSGEEVRIEIDDLNYRVAYVLEHRYEDAGWEVNLTMDNGTAIFTITGRED